MAKAHKLQTNFTRGELSDRLNGRPDLAAFFNGLTIAENCLIYPQGGIFSRNGTRHVGEVKDSSKRTRGIDFVFNLTDAFFLEFGDQYIRFYKNGRQLTAGNTSYEIAAPYLEAELFAIQYRQANDVMYLWHPGHAPRKLTRVGDTNWTLNTVSFRPPATFEADTDISGGTATLTPGATTGTGVTFTASTAVFLAADSGRQIVTGVGRAIITSYTSPTSVTADIVENFPNTDAIAAGSWLLRNSPQTTLDPSAKEPIGGSTILDAGSAAWRSEDVGKYVKVYGGVLRITSWNSTTRVYAEILKVLEESTTANPAAAPQGAWTLEVISWSAARGYPKTGEFHEGRLLHAATATQRTTWWGSRSNDFENLGTGPNADDAIQYTVAARQNNTIQWLASLSSLYIGTATDELRAKGAGMDDPIGGDTIPDVRPASAVGSMAMRPASVFSGLIFAQFATKQVYDFRYSIDDDAFAPTDLTLQADHITGSGLAMDKFAYAKQPNSIVHMCRSDGQLLNLTYYRVPEGVVAWTRSVMGGSFSAGAAVVESVTCIPHPDGDRDQVWIIVKRTINGATKRYVEYFEDRAPELEQRAWQGIYTDSAVIYDGPATRTITGLTHLEGETVAVVADGMYRGTFTVASGGIILTDAASKVEAGLLFTPLVKTMRPSIPGEMTEGLARKWNKCFLRLRNSIGANVNGEEMEFNYGNMPMDSAPPLFSGDKDITPFGWDTDGFITITHNQPYPLEIQAIYGEVEFGDWGDPSPVSL